MRERFTPPLRDGIHLVTKIIERRGSRNAVNCAPNSFTGEQQDQAHSLGDCVLTVDHFAHSTVVAAIFWLTFTSTLLGRTPASMSTRNLDREVSSVVHIELPVPCPLPGIPLTIPR